MNLVKVASFEYENWTHEWGKAVFPSAQRPDPAGATNSEERNNGSPEPLELIIPTSLFAIVDSAFLIWQP
eukprot:5386409-Amphidinium_carterae.1